MKRIALMSDTHWEDWELEDSRTAQLDETLKSGFDAIYHAGDVVGLDVLETLESFCPVVCVKGNCDVYIGRSLPHAVIEVVEEVKIGMIHGWELPLDHVASVAKYFPSDVNIIIHGHTHRRRNHEFVRDDGSKVSILNPGSVSSPRGGETPGIAELIIDGENWDYRLLPFR